MLFNLKLILTFIILLLVGGFSSCTKDKVPKPIPPDRWEQMCGNYNVYDTAGAFLYEMEISHIQHPGQGIYPIDTLEFTGFGGKFHFKTYQGIQSSNWPDTYMLIWAPNPTIDTNGKRWQLVGYGDNDFYYNTLRNDTIRLRYKVNNILYYLSDLVPYCDSIHKEIAVKQH